MELSSKEFYENWASQELSQSKRTWVLKWKAANLASLALRNLSSCRINSVCEIGGAEGTVLYNVGKLISASEMTNYELSSTFCDAGKKLYPEITFVNSEFSELIENKYDVIILSDIIEHVDDDNQFLNLVRSHCKYVLMKIPIEICVTSSGWYYWIRGRKKPSNLDYGRNHPNGHLRGYTLPKAKSTVNHYFSVLDEEASHVGYFYAGNKQRKIIQIIGNYASIWLFGGALFLLGNSRE